MLTTLRIKNLALVADLTVHFQPGYNVITGETGAGKSMLIGALNLVLGERADRSLIRAGCDACSVEAVFEVGGLAPALNRLFEENGLEPCEEGQLLVKRSFTVGGTNRQFLNGSPASLNLLRTVGEWLVDIHGPHEHQSLLHPSRQLAILDAFGKLEDEREAFAALWRRRRELADAKAELIVDEKTYAQQLDLLRFQVAEISGARLQPGEDEQVETDYRRARNAARLLQLSQAGLELLSNEEASLQVQAGALGRTLQELGRLDATAAPLAALHEQAVAALGELQSALSHYADKVELDPARLQELEERLNLIHSLKRKYGASVEEVMAFGDEAARKLRSLEQRDTELGRLNAELERTGAELWKAARELSRRRRQGIPALNRAVSRQLADLGFRQSRFEIALTSLAPEEPLSRMTATGIDAVEFLFAPNPGEPARPLRAIASSGELARVMLALKTVLAAEDQIPVLVFDEVDANIGGETANVVGEKMLQIARKRQVLCITHLPQVAAPAAAHYLSTKQVKQGRTTSEITLLDGAARVTELARMLGGQTDAARQHAAALLQPPA